MKIPEPVWRAAAAKHRASIYELLQPGLISAKRNGADTLSLDPQHPIYNFLIEYYGLKGAKGVKRLVRWGPGSHKDGILLQGATPQDFGTTLHLRGCSAFDESDGALYSPRLYVADKAQPAKTAASYLWYRKLLQRTLEAEPILYCYGLHEWAMQFQPLDSTSPPPSSQYQAHIPFRVSQETINQTVERRGTHCTHVDALTYYSPAARPLNHDGPRHDRRADQVHFEQPGCVHAHMDLLKIALRIGPFCPDLMPRVLQVVLDARELDIAASPYNVLATYGVPAVPVETKQGRVVYKQRQTALMKQAEPVRRDLLRAYDEFLGAAFGAKVLAEAEPFLPV